MKMDRRQSIQKWAGIVLLCGFVTFSAWAFLVSSNDFDPAYFKIANIGGSAKVTLIASSGGLTNNFIPALNGLGTNTTLEWLINGTFMDVLQTHDTHGIDLDYVRQDLSAITVLFRTVDGAMTFPNGFSFSGTASGGTFSGTGSGLTGIPLSGLAQSSATNGQIPVWNGTSWVPGNGPTNGASTTVEQTFVTDQHFSGKVTFNNYVLTNQVAYVPHTWTGATNILDISLATGAARWTNAVYVPQAVTGFKFDAGYTEQGILRMINKSSSNITFTCSAAGIHLPTQDLASNPLTVTNGDVGELWVEIDNDGTNAIFKTFH